MFKTLFFRQETDLYHFFDPRTGKHAGSKNDILFSNHTGKLGKRNSEYSYQESTLDLPITSLDALPLSYRRLVGAKAIKLGSWDKHPAYC